MLGHRFGIPAPDICYLLDRSRVARRSRSAAYRRLHRRRLSLNAAAFAKITAESAYWAGFLMADGCVSGNQVKLELAHRDRGHVKAFRSFLSSEHPVSTTRRYSVRLQVGSPQLVSDLAALGVLPRKSLTAVAHPRLAVDRDFWRGVVDGDGHIGVKRGCPELTLYGSQMLVSQFQDFVHAIVETKATVRPCENIYRFMVSGWRARSVLRHLYEGAEIALPRKAALAGHLMGS